MEEITSNMYRNVKGFWRRRGYRRLNVRTTHHRRQTKAAAELGGGGAPADPNRRQRRRFWKIKIIPKIKLNKFSPKKLLIRLRDGYVNFMLRLASSSGVAGGGFGAMDYGVAGFGMRPMKEYDEKVIVEIYKSIVMAQAQGNKLMVRDIGADSTNSLVVCAPQSK